MYLIDQFWEAITAQMEPLVIGGIGHHAVIPVESTYESWGTLINVLSLHTSLEKYENFRSSGTRHLLKFYNSIGKWEGTWVHPPWVNN